MVAEVMRMLPKRMRGKSWTGALFGCYAILMLYLMLIRDRSGVSEAPYWDQVMDNCNFVPFHTIGNYWHILANREYYLQKWEAAAIYQFHARQAVINLAGNVGMFVPLGIFLPADFARLRGFWRMLGCTAGIILIVELLQLFTLRGSCDVDDLILNLVGASLGWAAWKLWSKMK